MTLSRNRSQVTHSQALSQTLRTHGSQLPGWQKQERWPLAGGIQPAELGQLEASLTWVGHLTWVNANTAKVPVLPLKRDPGEASVGGKTSTGKQSNLTAGWQISKSWSARFLIVTFSLPTSCPPCTLSLTRANLYIAPSGFLPLYFLPLAIAPRHRHLVRRVTARHRDSRKRLVLPPSCWRPASHHRPHWMPGWETGTIPGHAELKSRLTPHHSPDADAPTTATTFCTQRVFHRKT